LHHTGTTAIAFVPGSLLLIVVGDFPFRLFLDGLLLSKARFRFIGLVHCTLSHIVRYRTLYVIAKPPSMSSHGQNTLTQIHSAHDTICVIFLLEDDDEIAGKPNQTTFSSHLKV